VQEQKHDDGLHEGIAHAHRPSKHEVSNIYYIQSRETAKEKDGKCIPHRAESMDRERSRPSDFPAGFFSSPVSFRDFMKFRSDPQRSRLLVSPLQRREDRRRSIYRTIRRRRHLQCSRVHSADVLFQGIARLLFHRFNIYIAITRIRTREGSRDDIDHVSRGRARAVPLIRPFFKS